MSTAALLWRDWFSEQLKDQAANQFASSSDLLRRNGILELVVRKWIREAIASNMILNDEVKIEINSRVNEYKTNLMNKKDNENNDDIEEILEMKYLNEELLTGYITNEVQSFKWAKEQWIELVPQLYLNEKDKYEKVKVSIITVGTKENKLLNEIYHAINNLEYTLEEAFDIYKHRVKGTTNGPNQLKLNEIKPQLKEVIMSCKINKISRPFKIEGRMAMIMVKEIEESGLTKEIEEDIIEKQLKEFIDYGVDKVCEFLCAENGAREGSECV